MPPCILLIPDFTELTFRLNDIFRTLRHGTAENAANDAYYPGDISLPSAIRGMQPIGSESESEDEDAETERRRLGDGGGGGDGGSGGFESAEGGSPEDTSAAPSIDGSKSRSDTLRSPFESPDFLQDVLGSKVQQAIPPSWDDVRSSVQQGMSPSWDAVKSTVQQGMPPAWGDVRSSVQEGMPPSWDDVRSTVQQGMSSSYTNDDVELSVEVRARSELPLTRPTDGHGWKRQGTPSRTESAMDDAATSVKPLPPNPEP